MATLAGTLNTDWSSDKLKSKFYLVMAYGLKSSGITSMLIIFLAIFFLQDLCFSSEILATDKSGLSDSVDLSKPINNKIQIKNKTPIDKIQINIIGGKQDMAKWESIARSLIAIKQQDLYSKKKIERAISDLVDSKLFMSIDVEDPTQTPNGVQLNFSLTPFDRIKDIILYNAFPMFHHEVMNAMTIYTGDVFSREKIDQQADLVVKLYKDQGYIDPAIQVLSKQDESDGNYKVFVKIDKKAFLVINNVTITGNNHFSSSRLKLRTKIWKSSIMFGSGTRFIKKSMNEDIKNLLIFYRKKGFVDVTIKPEVIRDKNYVDIVLHINEGLKYNFIFQGNDNIWNYTLKKELEFAKRGNKNNFGIRKSIRNLTKKYIKKGYLDVSIKEQILNDKLGSPSECNLTFKIIEGCQYKITTLKITGNETILEKEILKSVLTKPPKAGIGGVYVPNVLKEDIKAVQALYHKHGFTKISVKKKVRIQDCYPEKGINEKLVEVGLMINEGIQTLIGSIDFQGLTAISYDKALSALSLKPGAFFNELLIEDGKKNLLTNISKEGYPHVTVKVIKKFNQDSSGVNLNYEINEGPRVEVGEIVYVGNLRTREYILENEMETTTGKPFSVIKVIESRKNILNINAFNSTGFRTIGLQNKADKVNIVVEIEEKKPYFVEFSTGYDTERHLFMSSAIGDQNFMGKNLDLKLTGEISQIGYKGDIQLKNPKFFSMDISSNTQLFTEIREEFNKYFGTKTYGFSQEFGKLFLNKSLITKLGFAYNYREQYLTQKSVLTDEESEQYDIRHIFVMSPGFIYNTTDSYVIPKKGILSSWNMDISKGIENELDDFIKIQLDTKYYYTLFKPLTFAVRAKYGFVQPYGGNTNIPDDQLFFLGGTATVRGFDENLLRFDATGKAIGGRKIMLGSLEARYDIGMNFEITLFYDIGSVKETQGRSASESFRDSIGIGLRYMTPIGPIGLLYGWKLEPEEGESHGSFHFSMGYTF